MPGSFEQAMASDNGSVTSSSQLRLVRSIRLARALRGVRVVRLFRYVSALRWDMVGWWTNPRLGNPLYDGHLSVWENHL
jgi:hypothetical protein